MTSRRSVPVRRAWVGALVGLGVIAGGCGDGGGSEPRAGSLPVTTRSQAADDSPVSVAIANFKYVPRSVTVAPGTRLRWTNRDAAPHTATASDHEAFDTGTLRQGESKTVALNKPGTYRYLCEFHAFMTATVVVR